MVNFGIKLKDRSKSPEIQYLNTLETSILSEVSDIGSQFLNEIDHVNVPPTISSPNEMFMPSTPPLTPNSAPLPTTKPLVPCLSNVAHDYSTSGTKSNTMAIPQSVRFKTTILASSKEKTFSKSLPNETKPPPVPKGLFIVLFL